MSHLFRVITWIVIGLVLHSPMGVFAGDDPAVLMEKGNQAYLEGSYHEAIQIYGEIRELGWESPHLYYNLGNAFFKSELWGRSILNYERALRLKPGDEAIQHNLNLARQQITDQVEPMPVLFIWNWREKLMQWFSADTWAMLLIVSLLISFTCLSLMLLAGTPLLRKFFFGTAVAFLIFSGICWYAANRQHYLNHIQEKAIVMVQRTTVKSSPGERGIDLFAIHEGLRVIILSAVGDWLEIKLENGRTGWLQKSALEVI